MTIRDKVIGCFVGCAVGDALGLPCEGWTADRVKETFGRITTYQDPSGHKWHNGLKAGATSDDTQLTLAVAKGLIEAQGFDMPSQVHSHLDMFKESHAAWGGTTREAVRSLANGKTWKTSGLKGENRGKGNGLPMKISPVSAVLYKRILVDKPDQEQHTQIALDAFRFTKNLTFMTHHTEMALCSAFAQVMATYYCLGADSFDLDQFAAVIKRASMRAKEWCKDGQLGTDPETEDINVRFAMLEDHRNYDIPRIVEEFMGEGGQRFCCYWNMPLTYMMFLQNPHNINTLYDTVSVGGDADTNGAIVGAMLGALNGTAIFPQHLVDGLDRKEEIIQVAEEFCDAFGIL